MPTITATAAFRENGLIVVTFGSVGSRHRDGPAGRRLERDAHLRAAGGRAFDLAVRAAGARPSASFNPTSPEQSLEKLLRTMQQTSTQTNERRPPLHAFSRPTARPQVARRDRGLLALLLATPAIGHAEETNPNNYSCLGRIAAGQPEEGSEENQVAYVVLLQRPDHGLPAAVPDPDDGDPGPAARDQQRDGQRA